jgi:hypothetical protein
MSDYSYIGSGKIYLREVGASAGLLPIGNCSALSFAVTEDVKELKDHTQPGGGTYNEVRRVQSVEASISVHDLSPENLAKALFGSVAPITAGAVTDEELELYRGAIAPTVYPIDASVSPTLALDETPITRDNSTAYSQGDLLVPAMANGFYYKVTTAGTSDSGPPEFPTEPGQTVSDGTATLTCMGKVNLTLDTDFFVSGSGLVIADDAPITDGEIYVAGYTKKAGNAVEALTSAAKEYELVFEGLNEARSGKAVTVHAYRVKLGAAQNLALIGDEYAVLEMTGKLLKDTSKVGGGVSQYFKVKVVE